MNYMKKQAENNLKELSTWIGHFIRYWGFRKIHGEIWTLVYLSSEPLSGVEIAKRLQVSKALVSPALKELEAEGLIFQCKSENSKTKRYAAVDDVNKVIKGVLNRREKPMIEKIHQSYLKTAQQGDSDSMNPERLATLGAMILMAQMGLGSLLEVDSMWN